MHARLAVTLAAAGALAAASAAAAPSSTQFLRRPDVHGDAVVFQSEGDLWLGSIAGRSAQRLTSHEGVEGPAFFSPDGRRLAFSAQYDGGTDVYVMDVDGGVPRRLTWDPVGARALGWSADGSQVLFRSQRWNSTRRLRFWAVRATGGAPRLLPIPYGDFADAHRDGRRIAYVPVSAEWNNWKRYRGGEADDVWLADTVAHTFRRLTTDPGVDTEPVWVGDALAFVSERDGHANLWRLDPATLAATPLTRYTDFDVRYPGTDGRQVVFEHGNGLALWDSASGAVRELEFDLRSDRIHARTKVVPATRHLAGVELGPTGRRLLVSARGQILSAPAENGDVFTLVAQPGARVQYPAWSPDGRQVAFVSDASGEDQVWLAPSAGGAPRQLSRDHSGPLGPLAWSPDGRWLSTSDREMRVLLVDAASGAFVTVDQCDRGGSYDYVHEQSVFSPDGRWLAFARQEPNWNWTIWLYDIAARRATRVSTPEMHSVQPAFDPEGRYLCWLSDRAFDAKAINATRSWTVDNITKVSLVVLAADGKSPFLALNDEEGAADTAAAPAGRAAKPESAGKPADAKPKALPATRIDLAGIESRIVDVPAPADHYLRVVPQAKRLLLLVQEDAGSGPVNEARQLRAFDLKKREVEVVVKRLTNIQLSADGKKLLVRAGRAFTLVDADAASLPEGKGKVDTDGWQLTVDPAAEWRQMLRETWRVARDFFYDPGMHGVNWPAVWERYSALAPAMADRSDLTFLQTQMVGELNCGHAYIRGGDVPELKTLPMGYLGIDAEYVPGTVPAYRITRLLGGDGFDLDLASPLLAPGLGVKAGDFILAINGQPVRDDQELQAGLVGQYERVVRLTVNSRPGPEGAREVRVRTLAGERQLRYHEWVASRAEYVRVHGGGNLGYVHVPNMGLGGLNAWAKHYFPQLGKDGLVYDVRFNNGGFIDALLLLQAGNPPYSWFKPRYGASWTRQDWGFAGHSVALCNEWSISDAEEFSDAFQRLKLGPVIGARTWGGEVGSGDGYALLDGGAVYIPNYAEWVPGDGWVIEGTGVTPDIVVEEDPALLMAGRDPQLDRAIDYLREKLAREPVRRPQPPPFPDKSLRR